MRRLLIPAAVLALLVVARAYLATEGSTPAGQPLLEHLTNAEALKAHFNRDTSKTRVLMLLAPSCSYCLKGATVIERILRERLNQPLSVFVVWLPMLPTDWGRPGTGSLGRLSDPRVRQFWDRDRTVADALKASFPAREETLGCCVTDGVWWDLMAVFPAGTEWNERLPEPLLLDGTVEDAADRFTALLDGQAPPTDAAEIVAVEREFAADGAARGWAAAFRRYHAPEAIVLQPDPIRAAITLAKVEGDGPPNLLWRPAYAGIARSGDFGFTTGPAQIRGQEGVRGHYFTIWRKQADGSWKWIFDAGCDVSDLNPLPADADVPMLPVASSGAGSAKAAIDAIAAIEDAASVDARGAVGRFVGSLSADARVNRVGQRPEAGQPAAADLMRKDGAVIFTSLMRESSSSGDLVFTLGEARDRFEGAERLRFYARVWQLRTEGWRLVFDELILRRVPQG